MKPRLLMGGMTENFGGKEAFILNATEALQDDFQIDFLADRSIAYADELTQAGHVIHRVPARGSNPLGYAQGIWSAVERGGYAVIWLNQTVVNSMEPLLAGRALGVPVRILHSHSSNNMGGRLTGALHHAQRRLGSLMSNRHFACSQPAAQWFFGHSPYTFIPNAIRVADFDFDSGSRAATRSALGIPHDALAMVHVARIGVAKNHTFDLAVLDALIRQGQDAHLILVGDGPLRNSLEHEVESMGLADRVHFIGMTRDVPRYLSAADISILPSTFEGLPFTVVEAQASGLPCVVSDVVTTEVDAGGGVTFLGLSRGAEAWARAIRDGVHSSRDRANAVRGTMFDQSRSRDLLMEAIAQGV